MNSMTGYGKGIAEGSERKVTVEIKAVNHRFLDLLIKSPRGCAFLEDAIRKQIKSGVSRGHLDVYCTYEDNRSNKCAVTLDEIAAGQYKTIGDRLSQLGFVNDITASQVIRMPDVITIKENQDDEKIISNLAVTATKNALKNLNRMRKKEGEALKNDILTKLNAIELLKDEIAEKAPAVGSEHAEKLRTRILENLSNVEIDEARLLNEVAFFIDKASIDEEITRLTGHIAHGRNVIAEGGLVGKTLDFLVQEMNREANTIGSKSNDLFITQKVLLLKSEIEKVREQVQNLE